MSALLLGLIAPGAAQAFPLFPDRVYGVGDSPTSVVSTDLNGDGRPDLITVNNLSADISILLALEGGEFAPETRVTVGQSPKAAAVGDFNGDGRPDLVVCSADAPSTNLTLLLGLGNGAFEPPALINFPGGCSDILVSDFRLDLMTDVALLDRSGTLQILIGHGDGTFGPGSAYGSLPRPWKAMATGDFNQDGILDLALGSREEDYPNFYPGTVNLLMGRGDGTFSPGASLSTRTGVMHLVVADFNQDSKPDLATSNANGGGSLFLGQGNGTFLAATDTGAGPGPLIAGDFNADARPDLVVVRGSPEDSILVFPGRGDGSFDPALRSITGGGPMGLVSGNFDGDGRIDMATINYFGSSVAILAGNGDGTFGPRLRSATGGCPESMASGDFNQDGKPDLATGNYCSHDASILLGRGDGSFEPEARYAAGDFPRGVVVPDFDNDGIPDLAVVSGGDSKDISVRLGVGDGSFGAESRIPFSSGMTALVSADFNRDGNADLAVDSHGPDGVQVLPGLGNGYFASPLFTSFYFSSGLGWFLAVDDFNRDGIPDLAATSTSNPGVAILLGRGDGTFVTPAPIVTPGDPTLVRSLAVGDLDGDGNPDAVLALRFLPELLIFHGRGDGSLEAPAHFPLPSDPGNIAIGDFDFDLRKDLAVAEPSANDIVVLRNLGEGVFAPAERLVAGDNSWALLALDLNGDGWIDLASSNSASWDVLSRLNRGIPDVVPNRPPVADAGADAAVECGAPPGATHPGTQVLLDGSGSSDPDSTPGTNDDIVLYEWFEGYGDPSPVLLGTGVTFTATFRPGVHTITLKVTDAAGASATDTVTITVADTIPPSLSVSVSPAVLWPPNGRMVEIQAAVSGGDVCTPWTLVLESITESDAGGGTGPGDIQGAALGTKDFRFSLKAARSGSGAGRTYTITYSGTDMSGNVGRASATVFVPHDPHAGTAGAFQSRRSLSVGRNRSQAPPSEPAP